MAIQARMLERLLIGDGKSVVFFPSNLPFPKPIRSLEKIWGLRTITRALLVFIKLWRQVARTDVVHVLATSWVYFFFVVYPAVLYGRWHRKKIVLNYRGGGAAPFFEQYRRVIAPIFRMADVVSTPSQFLAGLIEEHFNVPVSIVPNIIHGSAFRYRARASFRPKMLVTRHLEPIYDVGTALKAFRRVQEHYPDASLWIAGAGSQEALLRAQVAEWNLKDVRFLGHVPHEELPDIYDRCDILLNSSRVDNFPGSLLEASGAGLVVVSTDAGGIPFMFESGKTALLVKPGDWEGLASAVEQVLQSPHLARTLTIEASALAKRCQWKEVRKALYQAYGFSLEDETAAAQVSVRSF